MTSPSSRGGYGGGYYSAPSFADTPIYDSLVAERGTPQIAPIRVPAAYESASNLPALPALASGPSQASLGHQRGFPQPVQHAAPLQQAPAPYIPQQASVGAQQQYGQPYQQPGGYPQQTRMRPAAPRPAAPRPMNAQPAPTRYEDPYGRPHPGHGY
ncbi:hypothetical protein MTQ01_17065 [Streptomyces sp. XM4193]|uniref:DUF6643 family protein n=1 Tax=Streptomyces sp. XM4193 TaxID=2929782 RepID=UPI001FF7FDC3|nr:DUF6643 family protein [Streptomyces sp. XM4193]MCK1797706.1 hypothetical protein [Streptomyces sp. XM4193]